MNVFVEECRREWKRLRVADAVANEMAADLEADLAEAEADGLSAEQVLGSGAFDARSFAASWATERGVIGRQVPVPVPAATGNRSSRGLWLGPAVGGIAIVATLAAAVALVSARSGSRQTAAPVDFGLRPGPDTPGRAFALAMGPGQHDFVHALGVVLLLIGLVGLVVALLYRSPWVKLGRSPARSSTVDGRNSSDDGDGPIRY